MDKIKLTIAELAELAFALERTARQDRADQHDLNKIEKDELCSFYRLLGQEQCNIPYEIRGRLLGVTPEALTELMAQMRGMHARLDDKAGKEWETLTGYNRGTKREKDCRDLGASFYLVFDEVLDDPKSYLFETHMEVSIVIE